MNQHISKGFSLIELIIVIMIIAVTSAIAMQYFLQAADDAKIHLAEQDLITIKQAVLKYYTMHGGWPTEEPMRAVWKAGLLELENNPGSEIQQPVDPWGKPYEWKYVVETPAPVKLGVSVTSGNPLNWYNYETAYFYICCTSGVFQDIKGDDDKWFYVGKGRFATH